MKTAQNTVPELRFPEFGGEWKLQRGNDFFISSRAKGEDGLPIYSVTLNDGLVPRASLDKKMENDAASGDNLRAQAGDLVYNMMRMWQGALGLANKECMVSPAYVVLSGKTNTDTKFFEYNLKRPRSIYDLWAYSYGLTSDRLRLYSKDFLRIKFCVPDEKAEQQKIASFLTCIDDKLTKLRRKRELLNDYKRGLMQQLFSQTLRFKQDDGSEFADWKQVSLHSISSRIKRMAQSINLPVMTISAGKGFLNQTERFSQVIAGSSLEKYVQIDKGEFAYNRGASKAYPFGCIYLMKQQESALIPFVYRTFKLIDGVPMFFQYFFMFGSLDRQLRKLISSSARMDGLLNIGEKDFFNVKVPFPCIEEQQKIADCLSSFDAKIDAVAQQIQQLETFKKGLLQKMFV